MSHNRGAIRFDWLFTAEEIGLKPNACVEHVVKVFLHIGDAVAARRVEMPHGILLLQLAPERDDSGAIYLYDRERQVFFFVSFAEGRDDALTATEFDDLVAEYDLISWAAHPDLLRVNTAVGRA